MSDAEIEATVAKSFQKQNAQGDAKPQSWSEKLGLHEPTASVPVGLARGMATGAVDLAQGVTSGAARTLYNAVDAGNWMRGKLGMQQYQPNESIRAAATQSPDTLSGNIGRGLEMGAEMAMPVGAAADAVPQAGRAGQLFQKVMSVAESEPVDISKAGDVALRIQDLASRGGSMPKAVRDFLRRATDPEQGPLLYKEGRDFASNISRLSADEAQRLSPVMKRELGNLRVTLNSALQQTANKVGVGGEYAAAMREYARAAKLRGVADAVIEGAKKAALPLTAGGAGYYAVQKAKDILSGE
jgi:hypothetical protein